MQKKGFESTIVVFIVLILFIGSLFGIFYKSKKELEQHLTSCRKMCYPNEVIESFSYSRCACSNTYEPEEK